jgi:hypothetical protein
LISSLSRCEEWRAGLPVLTTFNKNSEYAADILKYISVVMASLPTLVYLYRRQIAWILDADDKYASPDAY